MATKEEFERKVKEATSLRYKGEYQKSLDEFDELIKELSTIGEDWARLIIGECIHQLGATFQNMGTSLEGELARFRHFSAAFSYLWIAFNYRKAIDDKIGTAYTAFQIPMCRLAKGDKKEDILPDFKMARKVIEGITQFSTMMKHPQVLGNMFQNLGYIHQQEGNIAAAFDTYLAALGWRGIAGDHRGRGLSLARLVECCLKKEEIGLAEKWAKEALQIFRDIGDNNRIKQVEAVLAKIQEKENK